MEKPEEYISEPSELSIQALNNLPNDALKKIAYDSDWRTVVNYCKISKKFNTLCKDIWREKTIFEFGKKYWIVRYEDPLRNYLAARVRFLWDEYNRLLDIKFNKLSTKYLKGLFKKFIRGAKINIKGPRNKDYISEQGLLDIADEINKFELDKGNPRPIYLGFDKAKLKSVLNEIKKYYEPMIENRRKAIDLRMEVERISDILVNYLKSIADKTQSFKDDIVYENGVIEEFHLIPGKNVTLTPGKSVTLTPEDKEKLYQYTNDRLQIYKYGVIIFDDIDNESLLGFTEDTNTFYISSRSPLIINKDMERILMEFGIPIFRMADLYSDLYVKTISKLVWDEILKNTEML